MGLASAYAHDGFSDCQDVCVHDGFAFVAEFFDALKDFFELVFSGC